MADLVAAVAAERVYESVDELARAMHGQLATPAASTPFLPWVRDQPSFKPDCRDFSGPPRGHAV
jgi:hypothetical protein